MLGHPLFFIAGGSLIDLYEPKEKTGRTLAVCCFDSHAYFLRTAKYVSQWQVRYQPVSEMRVVTANEYKQDLPPIQDWLPWGEPSGLAIIAHPSASQM